MAKYTSAQVKKAFQQAGYSGSPSKQDIANANKFGLNVFSKQRARMAAVPQVVEDEAFQQPQDLLTIYQQVFGPQAGQALFQSLQPPTPLSTEQLTGQFEQQFNPYFQELQTQYGQDYQTQLGRLQEDLSSGQAQLGTAAQQSAEDYQRYLQQEGAQEAINAQQALGQYNLQFGETFGSPLQQKLEAQRQQFRQFGLEGAGLRQQQQQAELQRQKDLLQQNFQRRSYDIGQLNEENLRRLRQQREQALAGYVTQNQFSNVF